MATTQQLLQQKEAREAYEREQKIRMKQKELDKQKKSTSLLDEGTDTLTIINKDTGEVVRQGTTGTGGRSGGGTGLPSVTGGGQISQITQEDIERIMKNQPSQTLNLKQEKILQSELSKPIQEVSFDPKFGFDSKILTNAAKYLTIPQNKRTPEMQADIAYAYATTPAQRNYELQEQVKFKQQQLMRQATFGSNDPRFNINRDFPLPGDRRYVSDSKTIPLRDYVEPYKQKPSERTLGLPKNIVDISEAEYNVGVKKVTDEVPNMFDIVGKRLEERAKGFENIFEGTGSVKVAPQKFGVYGTEFLTTQYVPGEKQYTFFESPLVRTVRAGYDTLSDVASIFVAGGTKSFLTGGMLIGKKELIKYQAEGILNPRQAALEDVKGKQKQYIEETESDFYFSKQLVETSAILAGGNIGLIASIGSASRAEKVEDIILPLSLGVVGRLAAKPLGGLVSGLTGRTNKGIDYLEGILSSKSPVVKDVVVPNLLPRLTDSMVSKGLLIAGGGVELVGMQLTPLEQKEEYLRQVGLFNAYTPLGYRVTDVGLMVGKRVGVQALDVGFGLSEKYLGKDIRGFDTARYSDLAGEDLMKTPKFVGSEREMLLASQDIKRPGAAKFAFEKFDIVPEEQGIGFGFRSSSGKLGDIVEPKLTYYEGTKIDFFAPEINPIAMRGAGLKNKLFGKLPSLSDEYSLVPPEPALQLAAFKKATAVSIKEGVSFSDKTLDDLFDIYGWKGTNVSFSKDVTLGGVKVPKGKTFGEIMKSKIVGGDYGRPLKSREIIGITNEDVFDKTFIDMSKSKVKEVGGIFSSPSRSLGATSESEFVTAVVRERVAPMSKARAFFKKLGFADAYVYYDWDVVPINYYKEVSKKVPLISGTNNALTIMDNKRLTGGQKNLFLEDSKKLLPGDSFELTTTRSSLVAVQKGQGGYSKELEDVFGTSTSGKKSVFSKSILKPMVTMEETKVGKESRQKDYDKQYLGVYSGNYVIPYAKDYVSSYDVVYPVERVKDYDSVYTPSRTTSKPSSSSSRITSRPILSISRSISRPSTSTSRTISRPSSTTSRPSSGITHRTPSDTLITRDIIKSSSQMNRTQNPAYDVYVRKTLPGTKKVAPQLVARNVPINKGINEGTRIASRYTQRTVQLKRTGYTSQPDETLNRQRLMQYRGFKPTSKIKRQTINLVEKPKYTIDSYEEKQGIPYKGQQVRKKQAFIKKLRLI